MTNANNPQQPPEGQQPLLWRADQAPGYSPDLVYPEEPKTISLSAQNARWYDQMIRLSYGLDIIKGLGTQTQPTFGEALKPWLNSRRSFQEKTDRLTIDRLQYLHSEFSFKKRWYDRYVIYKRCLQQLYVMTNDERRHESDRWLAMSLMAYEYFEQIQSPILQIGSKMELGNLLRQIVEARYPLSTLETIFRQDLNDVLKGHLVRRQQVELTKHLHKQALREHAIQVTNRLSPSRNTSHDRPSIIMPTDIETVIFKEGDTKA